MTTEHAPAAAPAPSSPTALGTPTPAKQQASGGGRSRIEAAIERVLYENNIAEWAEHVAPRWVAMLMAAGAEEDDRVLSLWRIASKELKRAVWALASDELKARIRNITNASK